MTEKSMLMNCETKANRKLLQMEKECYSYSEIAFKAMLPTSIKDFGKLANRIDEIHPQWEFQEMKISRKLIDGSLSAQKY
ncbi:hypothetical protein AYI69_g8367 [Smittium culicis]|uniref:Uncharacterized protein n=1 Tax=Smittium culicis TaxID=133412 RepID=A0A1R1XK08_9FUNG|nr:hypothetical protein AYI69_g8367 [Smittium culicis]